jgi:hypothetical protein
LRETLSRLPKRIDSPYVFTDESGNRFLDIKKGFGAAYRRGGIKDFHFHDLRHTFASHLVMAGVDLTTVKELLGHKTLTITLRYSHLSPTHKANTIQLLDSTFSAKSTLQLLDSPMKKGLALIANPLSFLVELRGIEPLTPRLSAKKGRKTQSLVCHLVSRFN